MHERFENPFRIIEWSDNRCPTVSSTDNLVWLSVQQPLQSIIEYSSSSNSSIQRRVCEKHNSISMQHSISTQSGHLQMLGCTRLCVWDCHQVCTLVDKQYTILLLLLLLLVVVVVLLVQLTVERVVYLPHSLDFQLLTSVSRSFFHMPVNNSGHTPRTYTVHTHSTHTKNTQKTHRDTRSNNL